MKKITWVIFLVLCLSIAACDGGGAAGAGDAVLSGTVVGGGGSGVEGAIVYLNGTLTGDVTDSSGHFTLDPMDPGNVTVMILAEGYDTYVETFDLAAGTNTKVFQLTARTEGKTGTLSGVIRCGQTGSAIGGATVTIEGTSLTATTDASGHYEIADVPSGNQTINVTMGGYEMATHDQWIYDNFENVYSTSLTPEG